MDMKTSKRIPPGTPKYHRLTSENRIIIWTLKKEGKSETYIAARIGCSVSTISRELDRNKGKKGCRHKKAQGMAQHRIAVKAAKRRKFTDKMWKLFKEKPWEGWTPQMVVGRCRRDGIPMVCVETLYQEDAARFRGGWTSTSVPGRWRTAPAWATGRGTSSTGSRGRAASSRWSSA